MASGQDSSGTTLMDLITSDPSAAPTSGSGASSQPPSSGGGGGSVGSLLGKPTAAPADRKSKRGTLMQIQNETISAAKALNPPVSYAQLARSIHELAATCDQKSSQRQLVNSVFPKLAVYNSVDPSVAPSLLMLHQQCEDRNVLRYVYYYLARILSDNGSQGLSAAGGIPTPNWDALADIDAVGGVTRADVVPKIVDQLSAESSSDDVEFHARRLAALKALTSSSTSSSDMMEKLYEIVFGILEKVADTKQKRKKGIFTKQGGDKESIIRGNLQYASMSALRRLPLDPGNPAFLHRAVQGVEFSDPVAVRHALSIISEIAAKDPYSVAMALGALQDILHLHDVLARVYLAKLCHSISRARVLDQRPDIKSQYSSLLYQLLLDPSDRVCFEAIHCVLGKVDNSESTEDRAGGWIRLTREILKLPEAPSVASKGVLSKSSEKSSKARRPQPLIKLVMRRLESSFRSFSRPVLHAAARVVQEMGKSRAAAYALGAYDEGATLQAYSDNAESLDSDLENPMAEGTRKPNPLSNGHGGMDTIAGLLASLMEVVRTTATPDMAVTLLEIARIFATKVPGKIDADVLQLLWKTCLVGAGPDGKHTALEAVTIVLDLPPPQPGSMSGLTSVDMVSASDPKSAMALQRLVQAAVWFLGENANYAASEYAWESATPPGTALMMLDADKMVAAASSRNPTLASALTRLQRCAFSGSWEVGPLQMTIPLLYVFEALGNVRIRIAAVQALTTIAIRSGEPYRLQIYEFLHALALGGVQSNFSELQLSNGENQGASGTGLGSLISPMLKVLDEMYRAQDDLARDIRQHDNSKQEWNDEELKKLYETHERLLDFVSLFCFVPRAKYLPLGPTALCNYHVLTRSMLNCVDSAKLIEIYRNRHNISASGGLSDPAVATGISDLMYESKEAQKETGTMQSRIDPDLAMAWAAGLEDDVWANNAPAVDKVKDFLAGAGTDAPDVDDEEYMNSRPSVGYDDMWAKTILETYDAEEDDGRYSGGSSPDSTGSVETSISSHFGGMNYPSLFSSKPSSYGASQQTIREEPPSYSTSVLQKRESFENPLSGRDGRSFGSNEDEDKSSGNPQSGKALYDFTAGGDDELSLTTGEEVEIQYEVDGWYYVKKKRPGRDGKMAGLVPVLYVSS
ncbi:hypothetical protein PR202_ga26264 [Eleusine coracana subsp. coracana]|uniref:SH3 domain-containing protein n=1 Tax=Eleusine coracana subsp. coracana TaxID=191504 RepID=A0AAV5DBG5_ELECO|nr:hypothetical protein PR202_ga26264 [Eleusine coracana subsp. coracana]